MCGIIGYAGEMETSDILLDGLRKLEYRGYDSAGIAVMQNGEIITRKCRGRLSNLEAVIKEENGITGSCGIGHTRWATHGEPSDINSHPHSSKNVVIVHNGIIENYLTLKNFLENNGYNFESETDTEAAVKLIDYYYNISKDPFKSIIETAEKLKGSYALGVMFRGHDGVIYAARKGSPLIIGKGKNIGNKSENFIASDIPAIIKYTKDYYILGENEIAVIDSKNIKIFGFTGENITAGKELHTASWDIEAAEKGGYQHFMLKEMFEQPKALRETISPRIKDGLIDFGDEIMMNKLLTTGKIYIVACGTAMHAGIIGSRMIESYARINAEVDIASEFRYRNPILNKNDCVIIISQSGETADTLAALRLVKERGAYVVGVVNVVGSSIARESDSVIYTWAGPEIAVASTKAYSVQITVMTMLAVSMARHKGIISENYEKSIVEQLLKIPEIDEILLKDTAHYQYIASKYQNASSIFYIGRGLDYALSVESSLKLKEISYIHSEAYAAGELKHGTISLIEAGTPVVAVATQTDIFEKTAVNIKEVRARGAKVLLVCGENTAKSENMNINELCDDSIIIPNMIDIADINGGNKASKIFDNLIPIAAILPMQLFAYYTAVLRGCDVDKPRNLAKSVTVE
ncbi:MAG: glutamine--fructose-6-phosphate transaminase (isomerizing) [Oscillospiraceae bacterium]|nr:glutamine--fructose-6-phosphate transaminase (isomerizing) [Oscillospiraceae bacterium]